MKRGPVGYVEQEIKDRSMSKSIIIPLLLTFFTVASASAQVRHLRLEQAELFGYSRKCDLGFAKLRQNILNVANDILQAEGMTEKEASETLNKDTNPMDFSGYDPFADPKLASLIEKAAGHYYTKTFEIIHKTPKNATLANVIECGPSMSAKESIGVIHMALLQYIVTTEGSDKPQYATIQVAGTNNVQKIYNQFADSESTIFWTTVFRNDEGELQSTPIFVE